MPEKRYTDQHEWVALDGDTATVGISVYAAEQLGDVVFVELPEIGRSVDQAGEAAVVESVKAASEVYAPVGGAIVEINSALEANPALVNEAAEGEGWFFRMKVVDAAQFEKLMSEAQYKSFLAGLS